MQFKHPEILYFLFLLVIPILVHLFQLRRFKKEYFTNVKILKELSIQTRKSSKLKKWLLLATRLLLLASVIIAFAQPFFTAKDSKNASNELYIILDNSYSMQAKGQKGELLKRAVEDLLEHAPENQSLSLLTNSENFWNTDIKSIQKELQNLKYSATAFNLESVLNQVKARKSAFGKDVVIITDAVGLEGKQLSSINKDLNTLFVVPKAEQKNNISIDSVFINQTLDNFYEIGVKLTTYGDDLKEIPIGLYNKEKLVAKTLVKLESKSKTMNFTIPKEDFNGYFSISDNGLDYDNQLYFSISKPEKKNVISIGETEKSNFLSRIYTSDEFEYKNFPIENLDYNSLEKQDAIVLNELKEIPQALQTTLKSFVEKGGNLVIIPATESSLPNLNSFLSNIANMQFGAVSTSEKMVTKIHFNHPLFQSVFDKKIDNFQYPNTKSAFTISSATPAILSYQDQSSFLTAKSNGISTVYVFAAAINKTNSNFQNSPLIVPTFYNMAQNDQKTGVVSMKIGENNPFIVDVELAKDEILEVKSTSKTTGEIFIPVQQILNNKAKMTFNDLPKEAGNYGVFNQNKLIKNISFNYSRTEGNIDKSNIDALSNYKIVESIESVFDTLKFDRQDTSIWKWFVFLTLLFLVLEILIQKFVK
ncbi:MAG: BatA and WFA domain-containing protein [Flavobacterium sp.]|uniref:vWA domain-containing protein n=1 Tax=Flavobacterium sp. TaxID=239 RepID=UPI0022C09F99|nr:BatA and WFA domain-containing protein [Flavobacterium sp.]MCZ8196041.1 BatA and WFA domain-containing protein [Flavobacterium sp.]